MKYLSIIGITTLSLLTIGVIMSTMTLIFDEMSKSGLEWYELTSLIIGNCFMGYMMLLIAYFCVRYVKFKLEE